MKQNEVFSENYETIPKLNDFIHSSEDEPHCGRRKELIKKYGQKINTLFGHEPLTKYIVMLLISLQLYLAYLLREEALYGGTIKFWLIAYFIGATITQSLFLAIHEISHNLAFKSTTHNKLFGIFTNIPLLLPMFIMFKDYHQDHHKHQGNHYLDTDIPTKFEAKLLSTKTGKLFFLFNQTWFYAIRPVFIKQQPLNRWHILNIGFQITADSILFYYLGMGSIFYLLASIHIAGSIHPCAAHFIAEHYVFTKDTETYSYYGALNKLCFNVGYHNEHHDFPNIAWSSLPRIRDLANNEYSKLPSHKSWIKVLWTFLNDSNVTLFNRIKRNS